MPKKILLIGYGGTIFMKIESGVVVPLESLEDLQTLLPDFDIDVDLTFEAMSTIDSTNVTPHDWKRLAIKLRNEMDSYDGFIIAHGTNTMAYTASALALALGRGLKKPVVLTGSQLPLGVYRTDAQFNLENAIQAVLEAIEAGISEVMVSFFDKVLRGARTIKISETAYNAFGSPAYPPLAAITSSGVSFRADTSRMNLDPLKINPNFQLGVLTVELAPGQQPSMIKVVVESGRCRGLILKSHGAGSVPDSPDFDFIRFIQECVTDFDVPVIIATKFLGGNAFKKTNDAPAVAALEAGAIHAADMTDVMTEVKLMWLLAQGYASVEDLRRLMLQDFVGEVTEIK